MAREDTAGGSRLSQDALYRAFVGPNAAGYLAYFARRDAGHGWLSWHWPSLVAFYWALYRKQWGYASALVALAIVGLFALVFHAAALANASAEQVAAFSTFWLGAAVAALVIPPLVTLPLYYRAASGAIAGTAHIAATDERLQAVARRGGTSRAALWIGLIVTCLLPVALALLGR